MKVIADYKTIRHTRVLSEEKIELIKKLRLEGKTYKEISKVVNRSTKTVFDVCKGKVELKYNFTITKQHLEKFEIAKEIRNKFLSGWTREALATHYMFTRGWITQIVMNKVYFDENYKPKEQRVIPDNSNFTVEEIKSMRQRYDDGEDIWNITNDYRERIKSNATGTIRKICKREMFKNVL